jgi:hypothetical protein
MEKIELKKYLSKQINFVDKEMGEHLVNLVLIKNPLYMSSSNQREMKWSDDDSDVYESLERIKEYLKNQLYNLNNNN